MSNRSNNRFEERTIKSEQIFSGKIISLQVDTVELPDGGTSTREIVRHPGAVAVLALHEDKLIVVEQFRKPLGKTQVEIPAGKLEAGEDPLAAARRELQEETGYRSGKIEHLVSFYTSPGFADELLHLYVAEDLTPGDMNPDEDEFIEVEAIPFEQALRYIADGRISDAKTITAVFAWQSYRLTGKFLS